MLSPKKLFMAAFSSDSDKSLFKVNSKVGVVVGNEGQGVCEDIEKICYQKVKIPMSEGIESLNAGVSGSIIMYQLSKDNLK